MLALAIFRGSDLTIKLSTHKCIKLVTYYSWKCVSKCNRLGTRVNFTL